MSSRTPTPLRSRARLVLCALACATLLLAEAQAQSLGGLLPKTATPPPQQTKPVTPEDPGHLQLIAQLREQQATQLALLQRLDAPDGLASGAPPGTSQIALEERRLRVAFSVSLLDRQIADLAKLNELHSRKQALDSEINDWPGFTGQPPYSVLLVDQLRAELAQAQKELDTTRTREELLKAFAERTTDNVRESEARMRKLAENAERGSRLSPSMADAAWAQELNQLQMQTAQVSASALQTAKDVQQAQFGLAQARLQFVQRKLEQAAANYHISEADIASVRGLLNESNARVERLRTELSSLQRQRQSALDAARKQLDAATLKSSTGDNLTHLSRAATLAKAQLEATTNGLEYLRTTSDALRLRRLLWDTRYNGLSARSAESRLDASAALDSVRPYIEIARRFLQAQRTTQDALLETLDAQIENAEDGVARDHFLSLRRASQEPAQLLRSANTELDTIEELAHNMEVELGLAKEALSPQQKLDEWQLRASRWVMTFWNYELMVVNDAIEVNGMQITGSRSITVGKVINALLLFLAGFFGCILFARYFCRILVSRFKWEMTHANILRRWLLTVEFMILAVIVLAWAKIPLTVFAFLGGAIAIGAGFAMQTLLKNLMSGVMILGERPFRPGDFIEIGGTSGTVIDIGIRASTIRDVNGIETIIPNASFIEQNLTNWTYSSHKVRFTVRVGVAYGAPIKRVIELLGEAASRHGLILKEPAPEVIFEDFGNDAQVFALHYWLEMGPTVASRIVASDLRRMIESRFSEHGIVIAYPQRDVHLDASKPLPVSIVNQPATNEDAK